MNNSNKKFKEIVNEILIILNEKNKKYGDNNLLKFGLYGILLRMDDKFERILNIIENDTQLLYENDKINNVIKDALIDICGYSINALRLLQENKLTKYGTRKKIKDRKSDNKWDI